MYASRLMPIWACILALWMSHADALDPRRARTSSIVKATKEMDVDPVEYTLNITTVPGVLPQYLFWMGGSLMSKFYFGTPPQAVRCVVAQEMSDTMIATTQIPFCVDWNDTICNESGGQYSVNQSTSVVYNVSNLSPIIYDNGYESTTYGRWIQDTLSLGINNSTISNSTIGLITGTYMAQQACYVGLGPINGEITGNVVENGVVSPTYDNMLIRLKSQGVITGLSYSLWCSTDRTRAVLYFGGIDHTKYTGTLQTVPIVGYYASDEQITSLGSQTIPLVIRVMLHSITLKLDLSGDYCDPVGPSQNYTYADVYDSDTSDDSDFQPPANTSLNGVFTENPTLLSNGSDPTCENSIGFNFSLPVMIATSGGFSFLPESIVTNIASIYGMTQYEGFYYCNCSIPGTLRFNFSGVEIVTNMSSHVYDANQIGISENQFSDGSKACIFGFMGQGGYSFEIGSSLLPYIYSVINLDTMEMGFGQPVESYPDSAPANLEPITAKIPNATQAPFYSITQVNTNVMQFQTGTLPSLTSMNISAGFSIRPSRLLWTLTIFLGLFFI